MARRRVVSREHRQGHFPAESEVDPEAAERGASTPGRQLPSVPGEQPQGMTGRPGLAGRNSPRTLRSRCTGPTGGHFASKLGLLLGVHPDRSCSLAAGHRRSRKADRAAPILPAHVVSVTLIAILGHGQPGEPNAGLQATIDAQVMGRSRRLSALGDLSALSRAVPAGRRGGAASEYDTGYDSSHEGIYLL